MAKGDIILQGKDYELDFTITDDAGDPIDLTTLAGYICILFYKDGKLLQQYSRETKEGFKSLTQTDAPNGIFQVKLQSVDTKRARAGQDIFAEVMIETADVTYDNSTKHNGETDLIIGTIKESQSEQYTDLTT